MKLAFAWTLVVALVLTSWASAGFAQDAPAEDDLPTMVPDIDTVDAALAPPEAELVELTLGLYREVLGHTGGCSTMHLTVRAYLDIQSDAIAAAADAIAERAPTMTDEEMAALAAFFEVELSQNPVAREAHEVLYPCIRSKLVQAPKRLLDKEMRRFYRLHENMMLALVGNVD